MAKTKTGTRTEAEARQLAASIPKFRPIGILGMAKLSGQTERAVRNWVPGHKEADNPNREVLGARFPKPKMKHGDGINELSNSPVFDTEEFIQWCLAVGIITPTKESSDG